MILFLDLGIWVKVIVNLKVFCIKCELELKGGKFLDFGKFLSVLDKMF